jgi:hypothetical protein
MPLLGAHMSIAGGYYKAVDAATALGKVAAGLRFDATAGDFRG